MQVWTIFFTTILILSCTIAEKSNQGFKTGVPMSAPFPYEVKFLPYYMPAKDKENRFQTAQKAPGSIPPDYLNLADYAMSLDREYDPYNNAPQYRRTSSEIDINKNGANTNKNDPSPLEKYLRDRANNVTSKKPTSDNDKGDTVSASPTSSSQEKDPWSGIKRRVLMGPAPVVSLGNHSRYAEEICRTYNTNLMTMWKMLVKFLAGGDLPTPDVKALPNLFEMIRIYMELINRPLVGNQRENLVNQATGILKGIRPAERSNEDAKTVLPIMAESLRPVSIPQNGTDVSTWIRSKQTNSVDIMIPVPQSKCQEVALEGLMQTFRKLYQEYMIHIGDCQKQKKLK